MPRDGSTVGEVLIEIKATGMCHIDEFTKSDVDPEALFPAISGSGAAGVVPDVGLDGTLVSHHVGSSTFSNHTVLRGEPFEKRKGAPFDKVHNIGCDVTTGVGPVIYKAKAEIGCRAIVFGVDGIGLKVIHGLSWREQTKLSALT